MSVRNLLSRCILTLNGKFFHFLQKKSIPRTYLFNKEGEAIYTSIGYEKEEFNHLMNTIEEALK